MYFDPYELWAASLKMLLEFAAGAHWHAGACLASPKPDKQSQLPTEQGKMKIFIAAECENKQKSEKSFKTYSTK